MKIVSLNFKENYFIKYPVGHDINNAIEYVDFVEIALKKLLMKKTFKNSDKLNLWVRGSSGAILGAILGSRFPDVARVLHLKKEGESSHASHPKYINNFEDTDVNIILDDFSASGTTINTIYKDMMDTSGVEGCDILILATMNVGDNDFDPKYILTNDMRS